MSLYGSSMSLSSNMDLPEIKKLKPPKFWNKPTTKHYGIRTYDVHRLYGNSYREYKNNKMDAQAQSFMDSKTGDMPSSWCTQYQEPKYLTDTYISLRRPKSSKEFITPKPSSNFASHTADVTSNFITDYKVRQSAHTVQYGSQYLGGVRSTNLGGSSDSYARLESRFAKL